MTLNPKPYFVSIRICIGLDLDLRHVLAMFGRTIELPLLRAGSAQFWVWGLFVVLSRVSGLGQFRVQGGWFGWRSCSCLFP